MTEKLTSTVCEAAEQARYTITIRTLTADGSPLPDSKIWVVLDRKVYTGLSDDNGLWTLENLRAAPITVVSLKEGHSIAGNEGYLIQDETIALYSRKPQTLELETVTPKNTPIAGALLRELRVNNRFTVNFELLSPHGLSSFVSDEKGVINVPYLPMFGVGGVKVNHRKYLDGYLPTVPAGVPIPMVLLRGGKVRGRVTTPDGRGAPQAQITLFRPLEVGSVTIAETLTDREGFYQVSAPLNSFMVAARHTDFAIPNPKLVTLSQSSEESIVNYELLQPFFLTGTTLDKEKNPVSRVQVSYRSDESIFGEALTNDKGEYSIIARKGDGQLHFSPPPGSMSVDYPIVNISDLDTSVELPPFEFEPLPTIAGKLTVKKSSPDIPLIVTSLNTTPPIWTTTDSDGHYSVKLENMPDSPTIKWKAEHPIRFFRAEFETALDGEPIPPIDLKSFRPNLKEEAWRSPNKLQIMVGKPAPTWECDAWFNLDDDMTSLQLEDCKGKVIVLVFWGGFGEDSDSEDRMTEFESYSAAYKDVDDVVFLAIHDASQEPYEIQQTIAKWGISFPIGCDADPFVSFDLYNISTIPQTVIIDRQGVVRYVECDGRVPELIKAMRRRR